MPGCSWPTNAKILRYLQQQSKEIRDKYCCPTFIIAGGGPYLAIFGAIITDKYVVQRLTGCSGLE